MPDRGQRYQMVRTAKIRSHTRNGWTSARLPKLSAATCRANPTRFAPRAVTHNGCRTRSAKIRGDSAGARPRYVLRWSATEDTPNSSADPTAVITAISGDNGQLSLQPRRVRREPPAVPCCGAASSFRSSVSLPGAERGSGRARGRRHSEAATATADEASASSSATTWFSMYPMPSISQRTTPPGLT
jgi:hypothetical protein